LSAELFDEWRLIVTFKNQGFAAGGGKDLNLTNIRVCQGEPSTVRTEIRVEVALRIDPQLGGPLPKGLQRKLAHLGIVVQEHFGMLHTPSLEENKGGIDLVQS
jgi:hypothetical protein